MTTAQASYFWVAFSAASAFVAVSWVALVVVRVFRRVFRG